MSNHDLKTQVSEETGAGRVAGKTDLSWFAVGVLILIALAVGVGLRVAYHAENVRSAQFSSLVLDPQFNDYWARALVTGDWTPPKNCRDPELRTRPFSRPPGYPYALATIYRVCGLDYATPRIVQHSVGIANIILAAILALLIFGRMASVLTAFMVATYWGFIFFEGELSDPVFNVFFVLLGLVCLTMWIRKHHTLWLVAGGVVLGILVLFRPHALLFVPLAAAWLLWTARKCLSPRKLALSGLVLCVSVAVPIVPPLVSNYLRTHDFVFLSAFGGVNLYVGNNPQATCVEPVIPNLKQLAGIDNWSCFDYPAIVRGVGREMGVENPGYSKVSSYFYDKAIRFMVAHPVQTVRLTFKKAFLFWGPREVTNDKVFDLEKSESSVLRYLPGFPLAASLLLLGCLALWFRRSNPTAVLLLLFVLGYFASVIPYFIAGRYRIPIVPICLVMGAGGLTAMGEFLRERRWRPLAVCALGFGLSVPLFHYPVVDWKPEPAIYHLRNAQAFSASGRNAESIAEFSRALALAPDRPIIRTLYGYELAKAGRYEEALSEYEAALRVAPQNDLAHNHLGLEFARRKNWLEAIRHYEAALSANPGYAQAYANLGEALQAVNKGAEALQQYRRALELTPDDPALLNDLGLCLARLGQTTEARVAYDKALKIRPTLAVAHNNLGNLLASQQEYDAAESHYRRALELNAQDPNAYYNLANLEGLRNNDAKAVEYYELAAKNAPDNPAIPNNMGLTLARLGRLDEAVKSFKKAAEVDPTYANAHNNLGLAYNRLGDLAMAAEHFAEALRIDPSFGRAHNNWGDALAAAGRYAEAVTHFREALRLNPSDEYAKRQLEQANLRLNNQQ